LWMAVPVLVLVMLLIASFLPAARAARLRITDALGHAGMLFLAAALGVGALSAPASAQTQKPASGSAPAQKQTVDPQAVNILQQADEFRGAWPSLKVQTRIDNFEGDKLSETADFDVSIKGENSLVTFLSPKTKGQSLLMRGDDMWIYLPSVSRGVRITPIQRLLGNASNGDLARLRYGIDYAPTLAGEDTVNGTPCVLLDLQATRKAATYQRIKYAVRKSDSMPLKADFFLASGRHIKTAFFDEPKTFDGRLLITRITIYDDLKSSSKTVMLFSDFTPQRIDDKIFNPSRAEGF
jgi:outer membrane lipoprotein-sorting protein